jgi:predicted O-methyltransferase YrrM
MKDDKKNIESLKSIDGDDDLAVAAEEGQNLFDMIREYNPNVIVEVGTGHGYSTIWMALAMNKKSTLYTIDREDYADLLEKQFIKDKEIIQIQGELKDRMSELPESIDFVFLDFQHQIEKIVADIELIQSRLSSNGIIVVHDTEYCPEMGLCLIDYFSGAETDRLMNVGVKPSSKKWTYESIKSQYGLGIAHKTGKGKT